jgi:NADH-quinone oxidoreductase subunit I
MTEGGTGPPAASRGVIALLAEHCTVCMICARECPDWCITVSGHQEVVTPAAGGRPRSHNVLDVFEIDYGLCMYCGICVETCPFDALFWSAEYRYPGAAPAELVHDRDRLSGWLPDAREALPPG